MQILKEFWEPFKQQLDRAEEKIGQIKVEDEPAGVDCEKCGKPMVIKRGRYGSSCLLGISECKNTMPILEKTGVSCPKCGKGDIVARRSRRGRVFYGCSTYPECDYTSWDKPVPGSRCPQCGAFMLVSGTRPRIPLLKPILWSCTQKLEN